MNTFKVLSIGLLCCLIISLGYNLFLLRNVHLLDQEYSELYTKYLDLSDTHLNLSDRYIDLSNDYVQTYHNHQKLIQLYDELKSDQEFLNLVIDEYEQSYSSLFFYPVSPPVSKFEAIHAAFEYGNWTEENLKGLIVSSKLYYVSFRNTTREFEFRTLYEVTEPVEDYSSVSEGDTTYRYVWKVIIDEPVLKSIPPPGYYLVDAATGEVLPSRLLL